MATVISFEEVAEMAGFGVLGEHRAAQAAGFA
jgi:hypothetical protein